MKNNKNKRQEENRKVEIVDVYAILESRIKENNKRGRSNEDLYIVEEQIQGLEKIEEKKVQQKIEYIKLQEEHKRQQEEFADRIQEQIETTNWLTAKVKEEKEKLEEKNKELQCVIQGIEKRCRELNDLYMAAAMENSRQETAIRVITRMVK